MPVNHAELDLVLKPTYGKGINPNPYTVQCKEWERRKRWGHLIEIVNQKIVSLYEPRFITPPETAEAIAALVTMTDSRSVLELGTCSAFTCLHILKALIGKPGARIVTVDPRPAHDEAFFAEFSSILTHINGWTPQCLSDIEGPFDLIFVDSDHTLEHTIKEMDALMRLTVSGSIILFHDLPEWQNPDNHAPHPTREFLLSDNRIRGVCLPSAEQADCLATWGEGYPRQCNPGLGIFVRL